MNDILDLPEKPSLSKIIAINSAITLGLILVAIFTFPFWIGYIPFTDNSASQQAVENHVSRTNLTVLDEESAVINVVDESDASVVSIVVSKDLPIIREYRFRSDPFYEFFQDDPAFNELKEKFESKLNEEQQQQRIKKEVGGGTGFVVTEDGLIITNRHVVYEQDADYTVIFNNGDQYQAEVLARDQRVDIAVLKIIQPADQDPIEFKPLPLGDSDQLKVGQRVVTIGNALGEYRNTVSTGIVSGLRRDVIAGSKMGAEQLDDVIQTDAAINRGNSGGPLLDVGGQVIGVNVATANAAENISFSIPVNSIKPIIDSIKEHGRIVRPWLGVRYIPVTPALQEENNLSVDYGALVVRGDQVHELAVIPNSPAASAGIKELDIILELDHQKITLDNSLANIITRLSVGDEVTVKVLRGEDELELTTILVEASQNI